MFTPRRRPISTEPQGGLRRRILDAARKLYLAGGAEAVSARKIAAAVGASPAALYRHFRGIEDLLHALRMEGHETLATYLRAVPATLPALARLEAMGRAYHRFALENLHHFALMFFIRGDERPRREAVQQELFTLMLLRDAVAGGIAAGELRADLDVMTVTTVLWAQVHGVTALAVSGLMVQATVAEQDAVLDGIFAAITAWLVPRGTHGE